MAISTIKRNTRTFVDLDLSFARHPVTGDVIKITGVNAIKRSVKHLVLTNFYERPFNPYLGSNLTHLLFEPATNQTAFLIQSAIENVISNYEPRIDLSQFQVQVVPNTVQNGFNVTVFFFPQNASNPETLSIFLERTR